MPLFIILLVNNYQVIWMWIFTIVIFILSITIWVILIKTAKNKTSTKKEVISYEDQSKISLNYLVPYIISFMSLDLTNWQDIFSITFLMLLIFSIFSNSDLLYINPILSIFNYRIYDLEVKDTMNNKKTERILLISKVKKLKIHQIIKLKNISEDTYTDD